MSTGLMGDISDLFNMGLNSGTNPAPDTGGGFSWGNMLPTLVLSGMNALGQYGGLKAQKDQQKLTNQLAQEKFAEEKRQFDLQHALALQKLAQGGGGGGGGAAAALARQKALSEAYQMAGASALKGSDQLSNNYLQVANLLTRPLLMR